MMSCSLRTAIVLAFSLGMCSVTEAATIRALSQEKGLVSVQLGAEESAKNNQEVCFYAENLKKLACGTVKKIKKNQKMIVKIHNTETLSNLKQGDLVSFKINDQNASSSSEGESDDARKGKKKPSWLFAIGWELDPLLPVAFNEIYYQAPSSPTPSTLWQSSGSLSSGSFRPNQYTALSGQIGIPVGYRRFILGVRYQLFQTLIQPSDYQIATSDPFASTQIKASGFGAWTDFEFSQIKLSKALRLSFLSGLDLESISVNISATKQSGSPGSGSPASLTELRPSSKGIHLLAENSTTLGTIATATSQIAVLSLRVGSRLDVQILSFMGVSFSATAILPLFAPIDRFSATFADGENQGLSDPQADLKSALGLKKRAIALEATLATYFSF